MAARLNMAGEMRTIRTPRLFLLLLFFFAGVVLLEYVLLPPIPSIDDARADPPKERKPVMAVEQKRAMHSPFFNNNNKKTVVLDQRINSPLSREAIAQATYDSVESAKSKFSIVGQENYKWAQHRGLGAQHQHFTKKPRSRGTPPVLIDLGKTNRTENRILYYLHIHKSAGSTMCIAARENGLSVTDTNCNVQRDQRCCGQSDSLEAQERFAQTTAYQFVANERDMYDAMDPRHYRYAVTLRNSRDRYLSHWKNIVRWYYPTFMQDFTSWWKGQPDNWNVRKICGSRCMFIPKYQLTRDLFTYTVNRLDVFEDVLLFEQFNRTFANFAHQVGWTKMPMTIGKKKIVTYPEHSGEWDPLMSALDDALYDLAVARQEDGLKSKDVSLSEATQKNVDLYFMTGEKRACRTPCCAKQCSQY